MRIEFNQFFPPHILEIAYMTEIEVHKLQNEEETTVKRQFCFVLPSSTTTADEQNCCFG